LTLCILPVVSDNFIGGANKGTNYIVSVLEKARLIPAEKYEAEKEPFVAKNIAEMGIAFCPCARVIEESAAKKEMLKIIDEVRKLDEVEFTLNKDRIGQELEYKIILINPLPSRPVMIRRFLLSSQSIPFLEARLKDKKRK